MITRNTPVAHHTKRILRMRDLHEKLKLSPSHLYSLIAKGLFPAPFPLVPGGRAKGWDEAEIDAYLDSRKGAKA